MAALPAYTGVDVQLTLTFQTLQVTVGLTAVQLTAVVTPTKTQPILKADPANTGVIYVVNSNAGTVSTGIALAAGDPLPVPIDDLSKIWLIASAASQKLAALYGV